MCLTIADWEKAAPGSAWSPAATVGRPAREEWPPLAVLLLAGSRAESEEGAGEHTSGLLLVVEAAAPRVVLRFPDVPGVAEVADVARGVRMQCTRSLSRAMQPWGPARISLAMAAKVGQGGGWKNA